MAFLLQIIKTQFPDVLLGVWWGFPGKPLSPALPSIAVHGSALKSHTPSTYQRIQYILNPYPNPLGADVSELRTL